MLQKWYIFQKIVRKEEEKKSLEERNISVPLAGGGSLGLGTMAGTFSSATALLRTSGTLKI